MCCWMSGSAAFSRLCGLQGLGDHSCESMQGSTGVGKGESGLDASDHAAADVTGGSVDTSYVCWDSSDCGSHDSAMFKTSGCPGALLTVKYWMIYKWGGV